MIGEKFSEGNKGNSESENIGKIVRVMGGYEPVHFPDDNESIIIIGSNVPNSFFEYGGREFPVKTNYINEPTKKGHNFLFIEAVNPDGSILETLTNEYPIFEWEVHGREEIRKERERLEGIISCSSSNNENAIFRVFRKEDVPYLSRKKYPITERLEREYKPVFSASLDDCGRLIQNRFNYFRFGSEKIELTDKVVFEILKQVAKNIKPFVRNPELHPSLEEIEDRLRPGRYSESGFLGEDERLWDVIKEDEKALKELGVGYKEIADSLDLIFRESKDGGGKEIVLNNGNKGKGIPLRIQYSQTRGMQHCPWGILDNWHRNLKGKDAEIYCSPEQNFGFLGLEYPRRGSRDYKITNLETGESIQLGDMAAHLIGDHHFFEGRSVPYRMDPNKLVNVLGLR